MMKTYKCGTWILGIVALGVWTMTGRAQCGDGGCAMPPELIRIEPVTATNTAPQAASTGIVDTATVKLPRLLDLGATKCIPCKKLAPILDELKTTYAGVLEVEFIDVWENPKAGEGYGLKTIPTQIFYGADGKELYRHEGFISREDILAKWQELGVVLVAPPAQP